MFSPLQYSLVYRSMLCKTSKIQVLMGVNNKSTVFWNVVPYSLVDIY
jgi:hypothetical protein